MSRRTTPPSPKGRYLFLMLLFFGVLDTLVAQQSCKVRYQYNAAGDRIQRDWYCWDPHLEIDPDDRARDTTVRKLEEVYLRAMPNPATAILTVVVPEAAIGGTLELLSTSGAELRSTKASATSNEWDISNLDAGLYLLRLTKEGEMIVTQISIQH